MGNQWPQPLQAYWKTMGFDSPVFNYTLFLTGLNTCGSRDRACLSARFICCRYGDNVNESQTLPRAGIRAVATETGSVPSCRKQQRKHAVSTVTLSTPEQNKKKKICLTFFPPFCTWWERSRESRKTHDSMCRWWRAWRRLMPLNRAPGGLHSKTCKRRRSSFVVQEITLNVCKFMRPPDYVGTERYYSSWTPTAYYTNNWWLKRSPGNPLCIS